LRNDGSIYLWQAELYKEWSVVLLFSGLHWGIGIVRSGFGDRTVLVSIGVLSEQ
jgi:hypothetical protein